MAEWVVVVDDDLMNLKAAGHILSSYGMRVSAVKSGQALLNFLKDNEPDMVLLDIRMPEMDGFETLQKLRETEAEEGRDQIPVVFLTADDTDVSEGRGLSMGALDYIRKPFHADVLVNRIRNILSNSERIRDLKTEAATDSLTGFLNKPNAEKKLTELCATEEGALVVLDLDNFKLVNDIHGHEAGDKMLQCFSSLLCRDIRSDDVVGRYGGDEFLVFLRTAKDDAAIRTLVERLNAGIRENASKLTDEKTAIPLGVSCGAVFVPRDGTDFKELFRLADKELGYVKQNGKHGYSIYDREGIGSDRFADSPARDMKHVTMLLEERSVENCALWLGQEAFGYIYRFLIRYIKSYHGVAHKALFTLQKKEGVDYGVRDEKFRDASEQLGAVLKKTVRKSDIMMQIQLNQFFLLLPELTDENSDSVKSRIFAGWEKLSVAGETELLCEMEMIVDEEGEEGEGEHERKGDQKPEEQKKDPPPVRSRADTDRIFARLSAEGISVLEGVAYCGGKSDFYLSMLEEYAEASKQRQEDLNRFLEASDTEEYRTSVHALKSGSKMIGAMKLSNLAKKMEDASREGDLEYLKANHKELMDRYSELVRNLRDALGS